MKIIRDSGFTNPLVIDEKNQIIAGHGRRLAATRLGMTHVPCVRVAGLSAAQIRALRVSDNAVGLLSEWDEELLRAEIAALSAEDFDLGLVALSDSQIDSLLAERTAGLTDPDDAPPAPENPTARLGDVWVLGRHRLVCGDCTDAEAVAKALDGVKPHLMVTDPPYGVEYDASWRGKAGFGSENAAVGKVLNDDRADWREAWALFPGTVAYIWHASLHADAVLASLKAVKFGARSQIVWVKSRHVLSRAHYHYQHETAYYAVREDETDDHWRFVPEHEVAVYAVKEGKPASWHGGRKQSTVWFIDHVRSETGHSTQKPVDCMKRPIENNSDPWQAVYEPFSGSGTTLIAAEMTGRCCHALELNPAYIDVAVRRWQDFTGRDAKLEATGQSFREVAADRLGEREAA